MVVEGNGTHDHMGYAKGGGWCISKEHDQLICVTIRRIYHNEGMKTQNLFIYSFLVGL